MQFFQRKFPSANMTLVHGTKPVLIDSGFGSDFKETVQLLEGVGVRPTDLQMIINSHYHGDHVGGNHGFQQQHGVPIAAHQWEAKTINRRDRDACAAEWLRQPIEPYSVNHLLKDGDEIDTGERVLKVIYTPGHTLGHICLYCDGVLVCGDAFHADDTAWINVFREGAGAIHRALESLDKLAALPLKISYSGHGAPSEKPLQAIDSARRRYEKWLDEPEKLGWHACKRIFTYALMLENGLTEAEIEPFLLDCPWFHDYSRYVFNTEPVEFVKPFMEEILRSKAAQWRDGLLLPNAPFTPPPAGWVASVPRPRDW